MGAVDIINTVASGLSAAGAWIPGSVKAGAEYLGAQLKTSGGQKTYIIRPLMGIGKFLDFRGIAGQHHVLNVAATLATQTKCFIAAIDCFSNTNDTFRVLSGKGNGNDFVTRKYQDSNGKLVDEPKLGEAHALANRAFRACNWLISVADVASLVAVINERVREQKGEKAPVGGSLINRVNPWVYTVSSGIMGVVGLFSDVKFIFDTWNVSSSKESAHKVISLTLDAAYLGQTVVGAIGIYRGEQNPPNWVRTLRIVSDLGACFLPALQESFGEYVKRSSVQSA